MRASIIASSALESCVDDGSVQPLDCDSRIVVALSVESGQLDTEAVHATIEDVLDRTDGDQMRELEHPIAISMRKSDVVVRYPVTYVQDINASPREVIVHHDLDGCVDGDRSDHPSCGWVVRADGTRVANSQGFCCACSFDQTLGISDQSTRAGSLACDLFGNMESSHCLRMDPLWYSAFELGPAELHFTIDVTINGSAVGAEVLQLGPHAPTARSGDGRVVAKLIGDFAAWQAELELSHKYLVAPTLPEGHARVAEGADAWMLVDKADVGLDGTRCNVPGVSYSAFRNQPNPCGQPAGSCLGGQLEDLRQEDDERLAEGRPSRYLVSGFGTFAPYRQGSRQYVAYTMERLQASLVTLMLDAASIRFVVQSSPGVIVALEAEDFEAQSGGGELLVQVENTGRITADYSVEASCEPHITTLHARALSLVPALPEWLTFELRVDNGDGMSHSCTVLLKGALHQVLDNRTITFSSTERISNAGAQAGEARLTGLMNPGPAFSLRGNLTRSRGEHDDPGAKPLLEFSLAPFDALQYWRCRSSSPVSGYCRLEVLCPPAKINRAFFHMRLDAPHKQACVTAAPKFPCLNVSSAPCSQAGSDCSYSDDFGLAWSVEEDFREDLGC